MPCLIARPDPEVPEVPALINFDTLQSTTGVRVVEEILVIALIEERRAQMAALCRSAGVRRLDVFGSAVRNDFSPSTSDLDFVVEFDATRPKEYADAYFALKEGLETMFGRQVDLVTEKSLVNPYFRDRIASQRQTVYAR